jgi:hypothetical protein
MLNLADAKILSGLLASRGALAHSVGRRLGGLIPRLNSTPLRLDGVGRRPRPSPMEYQRMTGENRLVVHKWQPYQKNTLCGFATIELPNGLYIEDMTVHHKNGKRWVSMPSLPQLQDGKQRVDNGGKPLYKSILRWRSKELADQFGERVIAAIRSQHPGALA